MPTIIGAILSAAVKGLLAFFLPSKDQKLGQLQATDREKTDALNDIKKAQAAVAAVKSGDALGVSDDPANRDRG